MSLSEFQGQSTTMEKASLDSVLSIMDGTQRWLSLDDLNGHAGTQWKCQGDRRSSYEVPGPSALEEGPGPTILKGSVKPHPWGGRMEEMENGPSWEGTKWGKEQGYYPALRSPNELWWACHIYYSPLSSAVMPGLLSEATQSFLLSRPHPSLSE